MPRRSEHAAIGLRNGLYRLISVSWETAPHGDVYDYFHAGFEIDGRWHAEFYDRHQQCIIVRGTEADSDFDWQHVTELHAARGWPESGDPSILITVEDVGHDRVPRGALCQTVDERGTGVPRHWRKWRIV